MKKSIFFVSLLVLLSGCSYNFGNVAKKPPVVQGNDENLIKQAFGIKYPDWELSKLNIKISLKQGKFANGMVNFVGEEVGGGWWLAVRETGGWKILADGNGVLYCDQIEGYDVPTEMAPVCMDRDKQKMIDRVDGQEIGGNEVKPTITPETTQDNEKLLKEAMQNYLTDGKMVDFNIDRIQGNNAKGSVTLEQEVGGWWLAAKVNGNWKIVGLGSDVVDCEQIAPFDFPGDMVTTCYDARTDKAVNRLKIGDLDNILNEVIEESGLGFSKSKDMTFKWYDSQGKDNQIQGRGIELKLASFQDLEKVRSYFENNGYVMDQYNVADGMIVGLTGYGRDTIICSVHQAISGGEQAFLNGESRLDIEVKCGVLSY